MHVLALRVGNVLWGMHKGYLNDLFELDTDSLQWTDLSTPSSGNPPSSRYWHGFTSLGGDLFVFGGYTGATGEKAVLHSRWVHAIDS